MTADSHLSSPVVEPSPRALRRDADVRVGGCLISNHCVSDQRTRTELRILRRKRRLATASTSKSIGDDVRLPKASAMSLTVLTQFPLGRSRHQLGLLSGHSFTSGDHNNAMSNLRMTGLIKAITGSRARQAS